MDASPSSSDDQSTTINLSDVECPLCASIYYDPLTTPQCGHTFCRQCIYRALEVKPQCPLCRTPVTMLPLSHPPTQLLTTLLSKLFPHHHQRRKAEVEVQRQATSPRFGLFMANTTYLPDEIVRLHIFEPKYRFMVNRALSGTRQFIIVTQRQEKQRPRDFRPDAPLNYLEEEAIQQQLAADGQQAEHKEEEEKQADGLAAPTHRANDNSPPVLGLPVADPHRYNLPASTTAPPVPPGSVGVLVRLNHARFHPDGRSLIECVVQQRCTIHSLLEEEESMGLWTAEMEEVKDSEEEEEQRQGEQENKEDEKVADDQLHYQSSPSTSLPSGTSTASELRQRSHASSPSSSSSSAPASTTGTPQIVDAAAQQNELIQHILDLYQQYCQQAGISAERRVQMHGEPPVDAERLAWWVLRVADTRSDQSEDVRHTALHSRRLDERLQLCVDMLHVSIGEAGRNYQRQRIIVVMIIAMAVAMIGLNKWGGHSTYFHG